MIATPQLDELFAGLGVTVDVLDDLRDKAASGGKVGIGDFVTAAVRANTPITKAADGEGKFGTELRAFLTDRETAGHLGQQLGFLVHDLLKDLRDPAN